MCSDMQAEVFVKMPRGFNDAIIGCAADFQLPAVTPLFASCCIPLFSLTCIPISSLELVSILGMNPPSSPHTSIITHPPISFSLSVIFFFSSMTESPCCHPLQFSLITKSFKVYSRLN